MDKFWDYAEKSLVDGLYWEHWYNGEPIPEEDTGYIFFENKLLGAPRIRQIKVCYFLLSLRFLINLGPK